METISCYFINDRILWVSCSMPIVNVPVTGPYQTRRCFWIENVHFRRYVFRDGCGTYFGLRLCLLGFQSVIGFGFCTANRVPCTRLVYQIIFQKSIPYWDFVMGLELPSGLIRESQFRRRRTVVSYTTGIFSHLSVSNGQFGLNRRLDDGKFFP